MAKNKKTLTIPGFGKHVEQTELSGTVGRDLSWYNYLGNSLTLARLRMCTVFEARFPGKQTLGRRFACRCIGCSQEQHLGANEDSRSSHGGELTLLWGSNRDLSHWAL